MLPKRSNSKAQLRLFTIDLARSALEKRYHLLSFGHVPVGVARGLVAVGVEINEEDKMREAVNNLFKLWHNTLQEE